MHTPVARVLFAGGGPSPLGGTLDVVEELG
jgi:hypothetical protein